MHLRSSAFRDGEEIPEKYTHDGQPLSPPLEWEDVPPGTKSLALIVEDLDSPDEQPWVHWVVVDLPPDCSGLPEGVTTLPTGHVGVNDWERAGWGGPTPPIGRHHCVFKLYAIDRQLGLDRPSKYDFDRVAGSAIVLSEAKLVGTYHDAHSPVG